MKLSVIILAMVLAQGSLSLGARILGFFPLALKSHHAVFTPLVTALAARGHNVTYFSLNRIPHDPPNVHQIIIPYLYEDLDKLDFLDFGRLSAIQQIISLTDMGIVWKEKLCRMEQFQELLRSDVKYDLLLTESFIYQEWTAVLQHKLGVPAVEVLPFGSISYAFWFTGAAFNPSYMVDYKTPASDLMSFPHRVINTANFLFHILLGYFRFLPMAEAAAKECIRYEGSESRPPLVDLMRNKSLILYNSHFSLNYAHPAPPNSIDIGGINIQPSKPLPKELQTFMDEAEDGVIYFSFGSTISPKITTKDVVFKEFVSAFGKLKQKVLWKWESNVFPNKPANVKISQWFPQQDILAHKNCKLFITHGGYLSLSEAVNYGVPLIGIPIFGDQPKNLKHATSFGYGIQLDYDNITETSLSWAINEILNNPSYREAVKARSAIYRDRPMSPVETAVYWTEYVIRHGGAPHLRPALDQLAWYQSTLLDVGALLVAVILAASVISCLVVRGLYRTIRGLLATGRKRKEA